MTEQSAINLAKVHGGEPWHSGGGIWLVLRDHENGTVTVYSEDLTATYASREAFHRGDYPIGEAP